MSDFRKMTAAEIAAAEARGATAEAWALVSVTDDFDPSQLLQCRLEGRVEIGSGARIHRSAVKNYRLEARTLVEGVTALECRRRSSFGNGTPVAAMNECGGRTVKITERMSAQTAYMTVVYRHRPQLIAALDKMADDLAASRSGDLGETGCDCRIVGARFVREVRMGDNVEIDGASLLENGTLCAGARIGADVKAYDFIAAENARIDNGATLERCFVGESCRLDKGFTAVDSLFFANSHCENGEAASIFAGPYTVSHHKSSLLIAGMFSFFNAGSGSNQSNHLFKSGAVHQSAHLRGCKFASGAYIMSPAVEGAFTMVLGHHADHHDTALFPYSYLIEKEGRSQLMPGANLTSYGTVRDVEKWPARDRRTVKRDVIDFDEYNPYTAGAMLRAVDMLHTLQENDPAAAQYNYNKTVIRSTALARGVKLYNKAIVAALGAMLDGAAPNERYDGTGRWLDMAGQYITKREAEAIADDIEAGRLRSFEEIDNRFRVFHVHYAEYARSWAEQIYASLLGIIYRPQEAASHLSVIPSIPNTAQAARYFTQSFPTYFEEVARALLPIAGLFLVFQAITRRFKRGQLMRIATGLLYTYIGLVLFLCGVNVGFMPAGQLIGATIASGPRSWLLIPIGMLIGYYIVKAEPAVAVLTKQVEEVSNGSISHRAMGLALSIGVCVSVGLAMVRVLTGLNIFWLLIPGYAISLGLTFLVPSIFTGIAFDSGGVASGPMTATFLLPFAQGACRAWEAT